MDRRGARILITVIGDIRAHLDRGAPWDACDAFRDAIGAHPGNSELLYWGALAHARAGATQRAHALLDEAEAAPRPDAILADILSLRGRLLKDAFHRAPERAGASKLVDQSRAQYLKAYAIAQDAHPGINAAALAMLAGDEEAARVLAREVRATLAGRSQRSAWDVATEAEALLLLGELEGAARCYGAACELAAGNAGMIATMRRQVRLLSRVMPDAQTLLPLLRVPDVVAFAGHMIDAPDRPQPRFPPALVPAVRAALDRYVANLHQPVVFASAACGADLLFIEAALDHGAEVNIVLPFGRDDFVRTSVAIGGGEWVTRFDAGLSRATRVITAAEESYLGDDVLFEHGANLLEGFAALRASQLQTSPSLLCVVDTTGSGRVGGTLASFERWTQNVGPPQVIDLRDLRLRHDAAARLPAPRSRGPVASPPAGVFAASPAPGASAASPALEAPVVANRPQRALKTLLFADFAGYSRLHDAFAPLFQQQFLEIGQREIERLSVKPVEAKTWGDALYVVFESPRDGAEFALRFLARMLDVDWTAAGLADTSQIRIALHTGPVFCGFDPVMGRDSHFGASVTRTARIEPVTPPGMVYTSEAFAATLTASGCEGYDLEYIGKLPLAKGYGESRIYRLDRR